MLFSDAVAAVVVVDAAVLVIVVVALILWLQKGINITSIKN